MTGHPLRILITGASGFLGAHVARVCWERGYDVRAGLRPSSDPWRLDRLCPRAAWKRATLDLQDVGGLRPALRSVRPRVVVHCAAYGVEYKEQDCRLAYATNVEGTSALFDACVSSGVRRFVHIGSCFEYGDKDHAVSEGEPLEPTALYGVTKAAASLLLRQRAEGAPTALCILRPFSLWGPLEGEHRLIPQILSACAGRTPVRLTPCRQVRDYSLVTDMAGWIVSIAAGRRFPRGRIMNLGSGRGIVLKDFVLAIAGALGGRHLMKFGGLEYRGTEMWRVVADIRAQRRWLGRTGRTPFPEALRAVLASRDGPRGS